MAPTVQSQQVWQPISLNRGGVRRLKLTLAQHLLVLHQAMPNGSLVIPVGHLIPLVDNLTWYEFIFPTDQACGLQVQRQRSESGSVYYTQQLSLQLPQLVAAVTTWEYATRQAEWIAVAEDWNGQVYVLGDTDRGLTRSFQASTGGNAGERNAQSFGLFSEQLVPYFTIASYEDADLFPAAGFTYGFSIGFNS